MHQKEIDVHVDVDVCVILGSMSPLQGECPTVILQNSGDPNPNPEGLHTADETGTGGALCLIIS